MRALLSRERRQKNDGVIHRKKLDSDAQPPIKCAFVIEADCPHSLMAVVSVPDGVVNHRSETVIILMLRCAELSGRRQVA